MYRTSTDVVYGASHQLQNRCYTISYRTSTDVAYVASSSARSSTSSRPSSPPPQVPSLLLCGVRYRDRLCPTTFVRNEARRDVVFALRCPASGAAVGYAVLHMRHAVCGASIGCGLRYAVCGTERGGDFDKSVGGLPQKPGLVCGMGDGGSTGVWSGGLR
eukprot:522617-Rhodomonas_salina.1